MIDTAILMINNTFEVQCMLWKKTMKQRNEVEFANIDTSRSSLIYDERIKQIPDGEITYETLYSIFSDMKESAVRMMVKKMIAIGMLVQAPDSRPKAAKFIRISA